MPDLEVLRLVDFYRQDIDFLRDLGFEVIIARRWSEIPAGADIYFIWWWTWAFIPLFRSMIARRPSVVTGIFDYRWGNSAPRSDYFARPWWQRLLLRFALRAASANVFCSRLEYDQVVGDLHVNNPHYVPLTVDTDRYVSSGSDREDLVLCVALLDDLNAKRKCIPEIIEAIPLILQSYPRVRFVIAGKKGTYYPQLRKRISELGLSESIEFPGIISEEDKIKLMQRAKVYLQPTRHEGFGLAIAEAMSCGSAVVSSPAGAVPEVVGDAGLLVDPAPDSIARAVLSLLNDDRLRERLGGLATSRIRERFARSYRREGLAKVIGAFLPPREPYMLSQAR